MLAIAFKEWAAVCAAVATGRQSVILRKGGIAEVGGEFRPEHGRFWLYPTHFHEQQARGLKPECADLLAAAEAGRPPAGQVTLTHFVDVTAVRFVESLDTILRLDRFHFWSEATVRQRFAYRTPGIYLLTVRAWRCPVATTVVETPEYAGCKTWVELEQPIGTDRASPTLDDAAHDTLKSQITQALAVH